MQKLDQPPTRADFPNLALPASRTGFENDAKAPRRLLVVISDTDTDTTVAARRIMDVAAAFKSPILFLGVCQTTAQEADLRRQIILLSALVKEANLPAEAKIDLGQDWQKVVETHWRDGDVVICFNDRKSGGYHQLMDRSLRSDLGTTVYVFNDLGQSESRPSHWITSLLAWAGSIVIILGFLWLQVEIGQILEGPSATITLILSILAEFLVLWVWNGWLG